MRVSFSDTLNPISNSGFAADVNGDGVSVSGVTGIQKYLAGYTGGTGKTGEFVSHDEYELPFIPE